MFAITAGSAGYINRQASNMPATPIEITTQMA